MQFKKFVFIICLLCSPFFSSASKSNKIIWQIGKADNSAAELALGPSDYKKFLEKDFGYEDRYYLIGHSNEKVDFPYVLPGPADTWGGTWGTSGWRTHDVNVLFALENVPKNQNCKAVVDLVDLNTTRSVVKITVNSIEKTFEIKGQSNDVLEGNTKNAKETLLEFAFSSNHLKEGGNNITISVLEGGWIVFDQIYLEGPNRIKLNTEHQQAFVRDVSTAWYELEQENVRFQPLLVDVERISGKPELSVLLDGNKIFQSVLDTARYIFEAPMPAVSKKLKSNFQVLLNGKTVRQGTIDRSPQQTQSLANYVDTKMVQPIRAG